TCSHFHNARRPARAMHRSSRRAVAMHRSSRRALAMSRSSRRTVHLAPRGSAMRLDHTRVQSFTALVVAVLALPGLAAADENEVAAQDLKPQIAQPRVCSDPNNLPYSNQAEQGFENRLAELIADELDAALSYVW